MERTSAVPLALFWSIATAAVLLGDLAFIPGHPVGFIVFVALGVLVGAAVSRAVRIAAVWQRAVVLRLGKLRGLRGPGLFGIIPIIDTIPYTIDVRVLTTGFKAEKTLTRDTVPVDVDAVLFWRVTDPERAALAVADYRSAIGWAAQTALRDVIGKTVLADMLEGRDKLSAVLRALIDERAEPWGVEVISVELRDVLIPQGLENAMSMQAQAERERQARVILGDSERQIADKFSAAARTYASDPTALHLRAMNMLYEGLKSNAKIVIVPSSALDSMQLGGVIGAAARATELETREAVASPLAH
jgi:regulator of protease activity HflC (stomatin/prohibitin superfamily)